MDIIIRKDNPDWNYKGSFLTSDINNDKVSYNIKTNQTKEKSTDWTVPADQQTGVLFQVSSKS